MADPFIISVTAIIFQGDKVLVTKRRDDAARFPGRWTVPGGKVDYNDADLLPENADGVSYGILEAALQREVREEVGLVVGPIRYLESMVFGRGRMFLSFTTNLVGGTLVCQEEEVADAQWATREDVQRMRHLLIDGIADEIEHAFVARRGMTR